MTAESVSLDTLTCRNRPYRLLIQDIKGNRLVLPILLLFFLFSSLFNINTSPFLYVVPCRPFSECAMSRFQSIDTCVYLYNGRLINEGGLPYRDAFDHKGPLVYLIYALGLKIGSLAGVWFVQSLLLLVSLAAAYGTARLITRPIPAALAAGLLIFWYLDSDHSPENFAVPFLLVTLNILASYIYQGSVNGFQTFIAGLAFGCTSMLKLNLTSLWILFPSLYAFSTIRQGRLILLLKRIAQFLLGAAFVIVPIFLWLLYNDAFSDFIDAYWKFNLYEYGESPDLCRRLLHYARFLNPAQERLAMFYTPFLLIGYPILLIKGKDKKVKILFTFAVILLLCNILACGMKCTFFAHYKLPMAPCYLILLAVSFNAVFAKHHSLFAKLTYTGLFFLLIVPPAMALSAIPPVRTLGKKLYIEYRSPGIDLKKFGHPFFFEYSSLDAADWIKNHTKKSDRITGGNPWIYWHSSRSSASRQIFADQDKFENIFIPGENGRLPDYVIMRTRRTYTIPILLGGKTPDPVAVPADIETLLNQSYNIVYQNDEFNIYQQKPKDSSLH